MTRQIAMYQSPSPVELEARVHNLELQVAYLTEAVHTLMSRSEETDSTPAGD